MIEISLRARWKRTNGTILKDQLFSKKMQKSGGLGPNFYILAFGAQNTKILRHNLSLQHDLNFIEG